MAVWIEPKRQSPSRPRLTRLMRPSGMAAIRPALVGLQTTRLRLLW